MNNAEFPLLRRLSQYSSAASAIKILSDVEYQEAIRWIRQHFTFAYGQQIDWSHDSNAIIGRITGLSMERLQQIFASYDVNLNRIVTVIWAYSDIGINLPLYLVAQHINEIWLPVLDDVFFFDPQDTWCMELHHEGEFSIGKYTDQNPNNKP